MKTRRSYTMGARAQAVQETRRRILDATWRLSTEQVLASISLEDVAGSAEVSVQTVLRQFGSRAGLIEATVAHARAHVVEERTPPPEDAAAALSLLVDHYEKRGDEVLLLLAQERTDPVVRSITDGGKSEHRWWIEQVFESSDDALTDLLVVATDVYAWKLLRRDRGLTRRQTEQRIRSMVEAILAAAGREGR